jgi:hypothetical protein
MLRSPSVPVVYILSQPSHYLPPPSTPISQLHFPNVAQFRFMASPVQIRHNNPSRRPRKLFKINNPSKMAWIVEMHASYLFIFLAQSYNEDSMAPPGLSRETVWRSENVLRRCGD